VFIVPGSLGRLTGGFVYDRRIAEALAALGTPPQVVELPERFPFPDAETLEAATAAFARVPGGAPVLVDGLALGALPALAERHGGRLRLIALVHHPLAEETGLCTAQQACLRAQESQALAVVRGVICTSPHTGRSLPGYGVPAARIRVVPPGTDPAPLACGSGGLGPLRLLCVASLTPRKGHLVLLEALARLTGRDWHLTCVGDGRRAPEHAGDVRRAIADLGLGTRVTLAGEIPPEQLEPFYAQSDLFVLASHHEGYGMVLSEALARGLPVVSTWAGAIPDTVPPDAGRLVPPGNAAALANALRRLLDDADARGRLAQGAARARAGLPSWQDAGWRFQAALEELLSP